MEAVRMKHDLEYEIDKKSRVAVNLVEVSPTNWYYHAVNTIKCRDKEEVYVVTYKIPQMETVTFGVFETWEDAKEAIRSAVPKMVDGLAQILNHSPDEDLEQEEFYFEVIKTFKFI